MSFMLCLKFLFSLLTDLELYNWSASHNPKIALSTLNLDALNKLKILFWIDTFLCTYINHSDVSSDH